MQKKAKLVSVTPMNTSYTTANGTFWNQTVTFDDGTTGAASSKDQVAKWVVGTEYTFEVSVNGQYTNIKGIKAADAPAFGGKSGGGSFKPKSFSDQAIIVSQSSMSAAVQFYASRGAANEDNIFTLADKIYRWNLANYKKAKEYDTVQNTQATPQPTPQQQQAPQPQQAPVPMGADSGLPF